MTHEEILQLLYDETLVGNAPAVSGGVTEGLEQGLEPERMLYDALIPSLEEVGARFERLPVFKGHIDHLRPPVDNQLQGSSAWINLISGRDRQVPAGWTDVAS